MPYCNGKMEKGYFMNPRMAIAWYPEGVSPPVTIFGEPTGSITLTNNPFWGRARKEAYCCRRCQKIIMEY